MKKDYVQTKVLSYQINLAKNREKKAGYFTGMKPKINKKFLRALSPHLSGNRFPQLQNRPERKPNSMHAASPAKEEAASVE